jgi:hypothetical protein
MIHNVQFDNFAFQQAQRPFRAAFGRLRTGQGDEPGLFLAIEDARNGRRRALLAVQHRVDTALSKLLPNTGAHHRICAQGFGNFWIVPVRPPPAFVSPQEYPCLKLFLGRALAFPDQLFEPLPFVCAQFDNIALLAHLRLRRFESRQKRIIHSIQFS